MKFESIITLLFIFIFINTDGQTVQLSSTNINQGGFDYASTLGEINSGYIVLQSNLPIGADKERVGLKSRKQQLSFFDDKLNKKWQMQVLPSIPGGSTEGIILFQNSIFLIYSLYSKENNQLEFYFDKYDSSDKLIESKSKLGVVTINKYNDLEKTRILISPDKTSFGIYINESDNDNQNVHLITYSNNGITSNKDFKINYGNDLLYLNNFLLDNSGNIYMSGQLKNKENKKQKSQYLFCYISSINLLIEKVICDYNTPISDILIKYNPRKNEIVCGGISVDNNSYSGSSIKLLIVDSTLNFRELNYSIQGNKLKDLIGERNSSGISLDNYSMQDLILREDGGALLVAEAQYLSEYSFYDQFTQTFNRRTEYHFDNIVLFSVSPDEKIDWCKVIKKEQVSMDDFGIFSSFASYVNNDEIGIIYNKDSGRNFELMNALINKEGELTSKRINKSNIDAIIPRYSKQTDASVACIPVLIKRQLYLAKFEFE